MGSAIQNQDFTLIDDYCTGLKALLYLYDRLAGWDGQSPPTFKHQLGKPVRSLYDESGRKLPHFGPYKKERERQIERINLERGVDFGNANEINGEVKNGPVSVPKVKDVIGRALPKIGAYKQLDNTKQVVALIDDVRNGYKVNPRWFLTCYFAGYVYKLWKMLHGLCGFRISSNQV